jgi:hypothetical protein
MNLARLVSSRSRLRRKSFFAIPADARQSARHRAFADIALPQVRHLGLCFVAVGLGKGTKFVPIADPVTMPALMNLSH